MIEAGQENVLIWSKHKKLAAKRISAPNPNNAPINLLNYIMYDMVLSCHDNPKSIATFHGLRLRSHRIQCCGEKQCVFHCFSWSPLHFFCAARIRKNLHASAATEVETGSTFQPPLSTSLLHLPIMSPSETRTLSQQTTQPDVAQWILLCCPSRGCSRCPSTFDCLWKKSLIVLIVCVQLRLNPQW